MNHLSAAHRLPFHQISNRPLPSHRTWCSVRRRFHGHRGSAGAKHWQWVSTRCSHTGAAAVEGVVPFRKQLKDETKRRKAASERPAKGGNVVNNDRLKRWELTVGIEIHAELNTAKKLFSSAATSISDEPNSHVALFDAAHPGSQPTLQKETLLPALRAAIALNCKIQRKSTFDRKHYFYQDQPAGYQITQYYKPFAQDGQITLHAHDGIAPEDGHSITIPIKQIQMEQDTAKTLHQPPSTYLLDFNRVSHPLIEIISMPTIHYPATAAAYVRKIQSILKSVNACTAGMELGGLRADVNVSIRRRNAEKEGISETPTHQYAGFRNLGQRTEIKNLSSFKGVEDAIIAERDRQIETLESGGTIEGETRGFSIGTSGTRRLRGKEGEIDYRYMPDPDISPIFIADDLVAHLRNTLPALPDAAVQQLVSNGVTLKDARTLVSLDDGERLEYYYDVLHKLQSAEPPVHADTKAGKMVANWAIHELGSHLTASQVEFNPLHVPAGELATILAYLLRNEITNDTARYLFGLIFEQDDALRPIETIMREEGLLLQPMSDEAYDELAKPLIDANPQMVKAIREKGQVGKIMWFVGQMMRNTEQGKAVRLEAKRAERAIRKLLDIPRET